MKKFRLRSFVLPLVLLLGVGWALLQAKAQAKHNACIASMKQIHSAKESVALESKIALNEPVPVNRVTEYMKDGRLPDCPSGGTYQVGLVSGTKLGGSETVRQAPSCSVHGSLALVELSTGDRPGLYLNLASALFVAGVVLILIRSTDRFTHLRARDLPD